MAILTVAQARQYAAKAGFSGNGLDIIVAIAQAESGLNTAARHLNLDGSIDRGILQINNKWHPEVSDAQAADPAASFAAAWRISAHGSNFNQWATYTNGAYKGYLSGLSGGAGAGLPSVKRWFDFPVSHGYTTVYEGPGTDTPHYAYDFSEPTGTPFFFLESGTIRVADYAIWDGAPGGGEIFLQPDAGGPQEYAFHLDDETVKPGQHVKAGQIVGYTGGQNVGGKHPTSPVWSTGPHLHFGLFTKYLNTPAGTRPYGPDPTDLLNAAKAGNIGNGSDSQGGPVVTPVSDQSGDGQSEPLSDRIHVLVTNFPGFAGMALAMDEAEYFPGLIWYPTSGIDPSGYVANAIRSVADTIISNLMPAAVRSLFIIAGLLLLAGLISKLVNDSGVADDLKPALEMAA